MPHRRRVTLRTRIALVVLLSTGLALTIFSAYGYFHSLETVKTATRERMKRAGDIYAQRIDSVLYMMELDTGILASVPQAVGLAGLTRTATAPAPDQTETTVTPPTATQPSAVRFSDEQPKAPGASAARPTEGWTESVSDIFLKFLGTRPKYSQVRLLVKEGNWKELVRVNRIDEELIIVPAGELQIKGNEPYLQPIKEHGVSEVYFSEVTYNRENGRVVGPPTIRVVRPLQDSDGDIFGAIVINADAEPLLQSAELSVAPGFQVYAVSNNFDYISYHGEAQSSPLAFHQDPDWQPPPYSDRLTSNDEGAFFETGSNDMGYLSAVLGQQNATPFRLNILTIAPHEILIAPAFQELRATAGLSMLLAAMAALAASFPASRLLSPLTRLNHEIRSKIQSAEPVDFETSRNDEVSDLALSFSEMINTRIEEANRLDAILNGAADGIITIDADGTVEDMNPAAEELFGYTAQEVVGQNVTMLMPTADANIHHLHVARSLLTGHPKQMAKNREIFGVRKDGSQIPLGIAVSHAVYSGGSRYIGMIRDISPQKAADEKVNSLISALKRSNAELDQFAYVASHDLKAPLRVINNAASWLAEDLAPHLTEDTQESLDLLQNRATRMERLLDDLLQHSRIGREKASSTSVTGAELREELTDLLDIPEGLTVQFCDAFDQIKVQRLPLQIVLLNLISNAIRHHDKSDGHVWIDLTHRPEEIEFRVADDGPGIPQEYQEKVFEIFQTLKPRDEVETSGMGLAFVKKHAGLVGATIKINSDGKSGTTFILHWPTGPDSTSLEN